MGVLSFHSVQRVFYGATPTRCRGSRLNMQSLNRGKRHVRERPDSGGRLVRERPDG